MDVAVGKVGKEGGFLQIDRSRVISVWGRSIMYDFKSPL